MDEIKDGGPAFPSGEKLSVDSAGRRDDRLAIPLHAGMSLRDWFAGMALTGICTTPDGTPLPGDEKAAMWAYEYADAMLKARQP